MAGLATRPKAQCGSPVVGQLVGADPETDVAVLRRHAPGDSVDLTIVRGGQEQTITVQLGER